MKFLLLLLSASVLFSSCKKKDKGDDNSENDFAFTVKYSTVISSANYNTFYFPFNIKVLSGKITGNSLTCTLDGLPDAVTVTPASMVVGSLLGGVFEIKVGPVPLGDYPFRIKVVSGKYGEQFYNVTLRVTLPPDYAPLLSGNYGACYDYCPPDTSVYHYASQATVATDTPFLLKITNIRNLGTGFVVRAWISKSISVPVQTVSGKTVWGTGTYNQDARPGHGGDYVMTIHDTIVSGIDTQTCTAHIER